VSAIYFLSQEDYSLLGFSVRFIPGSSPLGIAFLILLEEAHTVLLKTQVSTKDVEQR
jgi:hypothetical protein